MHVKKVLCVGEILWDVIGGDKYLGGAPLNVAANISGLGAEAWVLSALGKDELGAAALEKARSAGIKTGLVSVLPEYPTGTAVVHPELDGNERFELPYPVAYDGIALCGESKNLLSEISPDAIVFGTLGAYRSNTVRETIETVVNMFPDSLRLYDVNLRKNYFDRELVSRLASLSTVVKLNDGEAEILAPLLFGEDMDISGFANRDIETFGCEFVVVTMGDKGAEMFGRGSFSRVCGIETEVADTVGAGDAFSAGVVMALLSGMSMAEALERGNRCGADCVSHPGAFPVK